MAARRKNESDDSDSLVKRRPPATTPEGREQQLIARAVELAEKQIIDGTASSQVITHFLKLGSPRETLERRRMEHEISLLEAKAEAMAAQGRIEELYKDALNSMRAYAGHDVDESFDD